MSAAEETPPAPISGSRRAATSMRRAQTLGGEPHQRRAGKTAGFLGVAGGEAPRPSDSGIANDEAVEPEADRRLHHRLDRLVVEIGRDLEQQRRVARRRAGARAPR